MPNWIYVTGFHRAGTRGFAEWKAERLGVRCIDARVVDFYDLERLAALREGKVFRERGTTDGKRVKTTHHFPDMTEKGFVCQAPMAAAWTEDLAKLGKVYWVTRNHKHIVNSMINQNFNNMSWEIMRTFREQWPDDPVWAVLEYDGVDDAYYGFPGYCTLVVKVKDYLYEKYLKGVVEKVVTEEQEYYDASTTSSEKNPLRPKALALFEWYSQYWEAVYEGLCVSSHT